MGLLTVIVAAAALAAPPAPDAPLPTTATEYAQALAEVRPAQRAAARGWDGRGEVPDALRDYALYEQRIAFELTDRRRLRSRVLTRLPGRERGGVRDEVRAQAELGRLARGWPVKPAGKYKTGPAKDAAVLWRYYGEAERRFGVSRSLLAAVNLVETGFNRIRSASVADAQGPMQFIRPTWRAYGLGGNIHKPRDAILGAANYLHANGAPSDDARALYHYNPSSLYVDAVRRYERRMRSESAFRFYYARSLFVRDGDPAHPGHKLLTGP